MSFYDSNYQYQAPIYQINSKNCPKNYCNENTEDCHYIESGFVCNCKIGYQFSRKFRKCMSDMDFYEMQDGLGSENNHNNDRKENKNTNEHKITQQDGNLAVYQSYDSKISNQENLNFLDYDDFSNIDTVNQQSRQQKIDEQIKNIIKNYPAKNVKMVQPPIEKVNHINNLENLESFEYDIVNKLSLSDGRKIAFGKEDEREVLERLKNNGTSTRKKKKKKNRKKNRNKKLENDLDTSLTSSETTITEISQIVENREILPKQTMLLSSRNEISNRLVESGRKDVIHNDGKFDSAYEDYFWG